MGLHNWKIPIVQLGCHDLYHVHLADSCYDLHMYGKQGIRAEKNSNSLRCELNSDVSLYRGDYMKGNHPLSKHTFMEIVNTTKAHRGT